MIRNGLAVADHCGGPGCRLVLPAARDKSAQIGIFVQIQRRFAVHGSSWSLIAASLVACSLASSAAAEEPTGAQPVDPSSVASNFTFTAGGGYLYGFDADFDDSGDMSVSRLAVGADVGWRFAED